jgi:hypothetical protein
LKHLIATFFALLATTASVPGRAADDMSPARPASEFLKSLGVNTHAGWRDASYTDATGNTDIAKVERMLDFLGVHAIRDYIGTPSMLPVFQKFGADGVHLDIFVTKENDAGTLEEQIQRLASLHPYLTSIEGPNEPDLEGAAFQGLQGASATRALQARLYALVHGAPTLANVPVVETSIGHLEHFPLYLAMANADLGNTHSYFFRFDRPIRDEIPLRLALARSAAAVQPLLTTETGWPTVGPSGGFVDENTQAVLLLDVVLDQFKAGVITTYIYQLIDEPGTKDHYGVFSESGAPKPAAVALHNLTRILAEPGAAKSDFTGSPSPSPSGMPATGSALWLQKSDHSLWLALWNEPPIWDGEHNAPLPAANAEIKVAAQGATRACLYDPVRIATPTAIDSVEGSFTISLPARPILLTFQRTAEPPCPAAQPAP